LEQIDPNFLHVIDYYPLSYIYLRVDKLLDLILGTYIYRYSSTLAIIIKRYSYLCMETVLPSVIPTCVSRYLLGMF
jgi:hypothetical protein